MATVSDRLAPAPQAGRWPMALRGFLCQNVSIGCAFGGFGVTVLPIKEKFGVDSGTATLGLALAVLAMGLVAPLVARMIGRLGLRRTMLCGAALSGLGYVVLAFAPNIYVVLAAYGLLIGTGVAMFGPFPSSVLASNWFQPHPGAALGFVNMPVLVAVVPMVGVALIASHGLPALYLCLAAFHLLLVPAVLGVVDAPAVTAEQHAAHTHGHEAGEVAPGAWTILKQPMFWAIIAGGGGISAAGITGVSHLVAIGMEQGLTGGQAALLLSVMGGASILGSLAVGVICNRIGAANTLALMGGALAVSWAALFATTSYPLMIAATLVIGAGGAGVFPASNMLAAEVFGPSLLARVMGLFGVCTLPLTFLLPPLAGVLRDASVNYGPVVSTLIAGCAAVTILFLVTARVVARRERAAIAAFT
ncbi:MAG: MFS transporter [Novosphingobium sp.]|nr:MFS transporter [Novosphingobium sp.]